MEMLAKIKADAVNNLSDGRYFAPFAEWVGFDLSPDSPHAISLSLAKEIQSWLAGPKIVAQMGSSPIEVVNEVAEALRIEIVQTDLDLPLVQLSPLISKLIKRVRLESDMEEVDIFNLLQSRIGGVAWFLVDVSHISWETLRTAKRGLSAEVMQNLSQRFPIIWNIALTKDNVAEVVQLTSAEALNLSSGSEEKVGLRAFDDLDPIVEQLEVL